LSFPAKICGLTISAISSKCVSKKFVPGFLAERGTAATAR
jgi:hypothetical protein